MPSSINGESSALVLLATVFFPPLAIFLLKGCGPEVIIGVCLTILGWIPGVIYTIYLWMHAGGFDSAPAAQARIDQAKAKYRERRERARQANGSQSDILTPDENESLVEPVADVAPVTQSDAPSPAVELVDNATIQESSAPEAILTRVSPAQESATNETQSGDQVAQKVNITAQAGVVPQANTSATTANDVAAPLVKEGPANKKTSKKTSKSPGSTVGGFYSGLFSSRTNKAREGGGERSGPIVSVTETEVRAPLSREASAPGTPVGPSQKVNPTITH